ncbi:biotin--[acetyl-CoA-carboxylase] ligase [Synechococcus sp. PCC 7336]|uniref:biotin--[acetyl-CoA-carboxylase] ligase n=1 Tax=Synechococcus sp. PCC 7336 TaxID=195250 RepID=UPI0003479F04|nr:biotin--[acetyl-CoA-carboxylase] ligase [Synechococcus sp. PCC 7336]
MLDPARLRSQLTANYCGHHLVQYAVLDSTNRLLSDWAQSSLSGGHPLPEGTAAIAMQQRAGRGQRGHIWESAVGGLYLSVLLYPSVALPRLLELTLAIAWGVALQVRRDLGVAVALKWPNDLVVDGRKLGGVLLQGRSRAGRVTAAIAGLGLNGNNPVPAKGISLAQVLGKTVDLHDVAAIALVGIETGYEAWQAKGLAGLEPTYESLMLHRQAVVPQVGDRATVTGIGPRGELQVATATGVQTFQPGEIELGYEVALGAGSE